jgi:hypothetical protein
MSFTYADMFNTLEQVKPSDPDLNNDFKSYSPPTPEYKPISPGALAEAYQQEYTTPNYGPIGYISPYSYDNWGAQAKFLSILDQENFAPTIKQQLDPNKIFNSDISALKTNASDQLKITRAFERKLMKSLASRENVELTENDINAMNAITSSRNTMIAASNGQVNIKKNIADIKLKQAQAKYGGPANGSPNTSTSLDAFASGRSILDSIMEVDMSSFGNENSSSSFESISSDEAASLLSGRTEPPSDLRFETMGAETYVVENPDGGYSYETYDNQGNIIPDFNNPTVPIDKVDLESGIAQDAELTQYKLKVD